MTASVESDEITGNRSETNDLISATPSFSGSFRPSPQSSRSSEQLRHCKRMAALSYLARLDYSTLASGQCDFYELGCAFYDLDRVDLAYLYFDQAVALARMDERVNLCLNIRDRALMDNREETATRMNESVFEILNCIKDTAYEESFKDSVEKMRKSPPIMGPKDLVIIPYDFEMRLKSISKFVKMLPENVMSNHQFAQETMACFEEYEQTHAQILGTLTSKNKIDMALALRRLFSFVATLPAQFKFIINLTQVPQLELFVKELLCFYPQPSVNFQATEVDDIIHYYDVLQKINEEADFLFFWEIYLKIELMLALKLLGTPSVPRYTDCMALLEKVAFICQILYELVKVDVDLGIKLTKRELEKRRKIARKFKEDISAFRKCIIEIGLVAMFYLLMTYSRQGHTVIDKTKASGTMFESFVMLAEIDGVTYNKPRVHMALAYVNELLAVEIGTIVVPTVADDTHHDPHSLIKMNELFVEKMISHSLCAVAETGIDDPAVPLLFGRILNALMLHGGYNVLTVWATRWIMEMAKLRSEMALVSIGDSTDYYFSDFTKMVIQEDPLLTVADKVYKYLGTISFDTIMNTDGDSAYILPQVLVTSQGVPIVLSEYSTGIWENHTLRINLTNNRGVIRAGRANVESCNEQSKRYLDTLFNKLEIPLLRQLHNLKCCRKTFDMVSGAKTRYETGNEDDKQSVVNLADYEKAK